MQPAHNRLSDQTDDTFTISRQPASIGSSMQTSGFRTACGLRKARALKRKSSVGRNRESSRGHIPTTRNLLSVLKIRHTPRPQSTKRQKSKAHSIRSAEITSNVPSIILTEATVRGRNRRLTIHQVQDYEHSSEVNRTEARFSHPVVDAVIATPDFPSPPSSIAASRWEQGWPRSATSLGAVSVLTDDFSGQVNPRRLHNRTRDSGDYRYNEQIPTFRQTMARLDGVASSSDGHPEGRRAHIALGPAESDRRRRGSTGTADSSIDAEVLILNHRLALAHLEGDLEEAAALEPPGLLSVCLDGPFELPAVRNPILSNSCRDAPVSTAAITESAVPEIELSLPLHAQTKSTWQESVPRTTLLRRHLTYEGDDQMPYIPYFPRFQPYQDNTDDRSDILRVSTNIEKRSVREDKEEAVIGVHQNVKDSTPTLADRHRRHYARYDSCNFDDGESIMGMTEPFESGRYPPALRSRRTSSHHIIPRSSAPHPTVGQRHKAAIDPDLDKLLPPLPPHDDWRRRTQRNSAQPTITGTDDFKMNQAYPMFPQRLGSKLVSQSMLNLGTTPPTRAPPALPIMASRSYPDVDAAPRRSKAAVAKERVGGIVTKMKLRKTSR